MNTLTLTTPALLFPAISLMLLAYTNRFLGLASLIRKLHADYQQSKQAILLEQLQNLKLRLRLIRDMQVFGVSSLLFCVITMFMLYLGYQDSGTYVFAIALIFLIISLVYSVVEIYISITALNIRLKDIENQKLIGWK